MTPNYPSFVEFTQAAGEILKKIRGEMVPTGTLYKSGWIGAGYALSMVAPVEGVHEMAAAPDVEINLEVALNSAINQGGLQAIDWVWWKALAKKILEFVAANL